ncbi:MAG: endonuclease [Planctomycetota bacterium]
MISVQLLDKDPNNPTRILLIYNGASVLGAWDNGTTWDREHQWPRSLGVGTSGPDNSDLFQLRPCNPSINGSRGNSPYGIGGGYWDPAALALPGVNDRGDCSRTCFYIAVRYDGSDTNTVDLELVNGLPGANQMGDLAKMLEWHFSEPVNNIELRRNHLVWSSVDNPSYFQGNRNPFIDRPEFVWAIWGPTPNDSTLYFGGSVPSDGASSTNLVIQSLVNGSPAPSIVTLHKVGTNPTTYNATLSGAINSPSVGTKKTFIGGTQDLNIQVALNSTATVGSFNGTITIDNTDLTSAGPGKGVADLNDVINVAASVLDHAEASFESAFDEDVLTIDLGTVTLNEADLQVPFTIYNLENTPALTAALAIDSSVGSGDTTALSFNFAPVAALPANTGHTFVATLDSNLPFGTYQATYTINVTDTNLPGAQGGNDLTLNLVGQVLEPLQVPAVSEWGMIVFFLATLCTASIVHRRRAM